MADSTIYSRVGAAAMCEPYSVLLVTQQKLPSFNFFL
jgi:hypothetical protein